MKARRGVYFVSFLSSACALLGLGLLSWNRYLHSPTRGLPYHDSFVNEDSSGWKAFGGAWKLAGGLMRNDSDERGAKLITGSPFWRNYSVDADIMLLDKNGDAGLMLRSSDEDEGINAYKGYYAGVRTFDDALVLGRANNDWIEAKRSSRMSGGIRPFRWYHLRLLAYDCHIIAAVSSPGQVTRTLLAINDSDCFQSGHIGLRSYSSGGIWRNIVVQRVTQGDMEALLLEARTQKHSEPDHIVLQDRAPPNADSYVPGSRLAPFDAGSIQTIASLKLDALAKARTATIRGAVILTSPLLFIQDSTGGIYVPEPNEPPLKVGDEVEVSGEVHSGDFSSRIEHANVRVLWTRSPVPPVSVTAFQASTGKYDATYIELQGRLTAKERGPGNSIILDLAEGAQSFRAVVSFDIASSQSRTLELDSTLRLRGVCVLDTAFTQGVTPFVLLMGSGDDIEVLSGPPWWNLRHIVVIAIGVLMFSAIAAVLHHRLQNWRFSAVLEERGRMAHEIHDTLAQNFAGIGFQLQAIRSGLPTESEATLKQLDLACNLVKRSHEEARGSILMLNTDSPGFQDPLSALAASTRRMVAGGPLQVTCERIGEFRPMPLRVADTLFRIGQEAVANCIRHAQATELTIRLGYEANCARLRIEDNGTGFRNEKNLRGFGIRGMHKRAQSISAVFTIDSAPGMGTRVEVTAPLPPEITLISWPKLVWTFVKEHGAYARSARHSDSHTYRG